MLSDQDAQQCSGARTSVRKSLTCTFDSSSVRFRSKAKGWIKQVRNFKEHQSSLFNFKIKTVKIKFIFYKSTWRALYKNMCQTISFVLLANSVLILSNRLVAKMVRHEAEMLKGALRPRHMPDRTIQIPRNRRA